jgi:hypothetical protein
MKIFILKVWKDPVCSKVIAVGIVSSIAWGFTNIHVAANFFISIFGNNPFNWAQNALAILAIVCLFLTFFYLSNERRKHRSNIQYLVNQVDTSAIASDILKQGGVTEGYLKINGHKPEYQRAVDYLVANGLIEGANNTFKELPITEKGLAVRSFLTN